MLDYETFIETVAEEARVPREDAETLAALMSPHRSAVGLGGVLTENLNWRWVFYVNLPVGLIAFAGIWLFMPRRPTTTSRFDLFGFAFLALGIAGSLYTARRITHRRYQSITRRTGTFVPMAVLIAFLGALNIYLFLLPMAHRM